MLIYELPYEQTPYGYHHPNGDQENGWKEYERKTPYGLDNIGSKVSVVFYWYSGGSYCGSGQFLMKLKDGKWILHDGGHCSCNGPLDDIDYDATFESLDKVLSMCSQNYLGVVQPLIDMVREQDYK